MENTRTFNCNGLTNNTTTQIENFLKGIEALKEQKVSSEIILEYIQNGRRIEGVDEEIYKQMDTLKGYQAQAILNELPFIERQARSQGLTLPPIVKRVQDTGKIDTIPAIVSFSQAALERVPNLKVFTPFMWVSEKELEELNNSQNNNSHHNSPHDDDDEMSL